MKTLLISLALLVASSAAISQSLSTVTINATGTRNKQIFVDNNSYTIDNTTNTEVKEMVIPNVSPGQHSLELIRTNTNNNRQSTKTSFTTREGYDLTITIASNGTISTAEKRTSGQGNNANRPLTIAQFNKLYAGAKAKTSSSARATYLENEFNASTRPMTARQASQLIQLVSSESSRLKLAKLSYTRVSDRQNFNLVANLLNSTINKNELNAYIATIDTDADTGDTDATAAMDDARFRVIYNEILAEPTVADRAYYLNNFFSRDFNYYTSAQAKQFIELVSGEQDRLALAKAAYRGVTDRENYSVMYALLNSPVNRTSLQAHINSYDNANPRAAMSSANFDKLYNSVYSSNSSTTRYSAINKAFTTAGNYFTVAQVKKLIPLVSGETNRLQLAKTSYKVLVDKSNYLQFNDFLSTTTSRNDFKNYVSSFANTGVDIGEAMSDADYDKIYRSVTGNWTSASKVQALFDAFNKNTNYFTTYQVKQLLALISKENDRLPLAKNAYDNVVDLANYTQLDDLFTTTANKNDLASFVSHMQSGNSSAVKIAMAESSFKSLYSQVQLTFGIGAKYSALTEIFNTETNYFTVAQAKQLIQLVSSETNRLELAKSSYNNITDPANFTQLYDILSSQSSRNELAAYVSSNAVNN